MRSNVCTLILAAACLAPSTLRAEPLDLHEVHVVADVIAVDPLTQTVRLRGPTRVVDLRVDDAEQFKLVAVDDLKSFWGVLGCSCFAF